MSDDYHEEANPLLVLLFSQQSFVGDGEKVENEVMPIDDQLNFSVGDCAIIAQANTKLENDLIFVRAINPIDHQGDYPDWPEREMNSYLLCEYFSAADPEFSIGWFSRLKLMPIKQYRYKEARGWRKNGFPNRLPKWIEDVHDKYTERLAEHSPETVPRPTHCPNCDSTDVDLVVSRKVDYRGRVGTLTIEEREFYVPVVEPVEHSSHVARLFCNNCDSKADLVDNEWQLPGISY